MLTTNSQKKEYLERAMKELTGGVAISTAEVAQVMHCGRTAARAFTKDLPKYAGRYLIVDVASKIVECAKY